MVNSIHINAFKSLRNLEIELGAVNVFIGANGSGKSNILEAIGVLSSAASGRVDDEALLRRGVRPGLPRLYKSSFKNDRTPPYITLEARSDQASYSVSLLNPLKDPKPAWTFKKENLKSGQGNIISRGVKEKDTYDPERGIAALKAVELEKDDPAMSLLTALQEYAIYTPNTATLRGVVTDAQNRDPVGLSGGGLSIALQNLKQLALKDEQIDEALEDVISTMDWVERIDMSTSASELLSRSIPRSKKILRFTDRFMVDDRNTLTAYDASEGVLYMLFVAVLALAPTAPACLAIDNLDQALNPRLVKELARLICEWFTEYRNDRQILCTSHNPAVIDGLSLDDDRVRLFAVDRNSMGHTTVRRIEMTPELSGLSKGNEWPLSRLWMMGHIGGVPNV